LFPYFGCKGKEKDWNNKQKERKNAEKVEKSHFLTFGKIVKGVICARTPYYI